VLDGDGRALPPELFYGSIRLPNGVEQDIKRFTDLPRVVTEANGPRR
jgi:hypothetical protein